MYLLEVQCEVGLPIAGIVYHAGHVAEERIGFTAQVCVGAAPRPIAGLVDEPRPNRVEFDIAQGGRKMLLVHHERRETPLPQIPPPSFAEVDVTRVTLVRFADGAAQPLERFRHGDQMDMVRHQAIGLDTDPVPVAPGFRQGQVDAAILLTQKGLHPSCGFSVA